MNKLTKEELLIQRNVLKERMDLRKLFIKVDLDIIKLTTKSLERSKKEYKEFEREYLSLLDQLE